MTTRDDIRKLLATELDIAVDQLEDGADLFTQGIHSLLLMKTAGWLRRSGHRIRYADLVEVPTIDAWVALLDGAAETGTASDGGADGEVAADGSAPEPDEAVIDLTETDDPDFGLATMQHALWIGRQEGQRLGGVAAHLYVEFDGAGIDPDRLRRALDRTIARHDMLRAAFGDNATQRILAEAPDAVWSVTDLRDEPPAVVAERLEATRHQKSHQQMAVGLGQVIDVSTTLLPDGAHRIHIDVDMLAADAMSYRRILNDLAVYYNEDRDDALAPIGCSYRQYLSARARHRDRATAEIETHRQWWADRLADLPEIPELPTIGEAERADPTASVRLHHHLGVTQRRGLEEAARTLGLTPAALLAALFSEVIATWSASQRLLLNIPLFNREPLFPDVELLVGDFTNSVLVDVDLSQPVSVAERARGLQRSLHEATAHSAYEGLDVLRDLGRLRGNAVTPSVVFTSGLNLGELFSASVTETLGRPGWILSQGPQVDLDAQVVELDGGMLVNWDLRRDALPAGMGEAMFAAFTELLTAAGNGDLDWSGVTSVELDEDQRRGRTLANRALDRRPPVRNLLDPFFEYVGATPDAVALEWPGGGSLSYRRLADEALRLTAALRAAGVAPGDDVALLVPRGPQQVVAVLGVLAAGGVYVPVGTDLPVARQAAILRRSGASVLVTSGGSGGEELPNDVVTVDLMSLDGVEPAVPYSPDPESPAYVLFTSGSTGEPKGVEIIHQAAASTIDALAGHYELSADDRAIGLAPLGFDISVLDIFGALNFGGSLVCLDEDTARDPVAWTRLIAAHGVTVVGAAPGLIAALDSVSTADDIASIRLIMTGGDRVDHALGRRLREKVPALRFIALGGATEAAIHTTIFELADTTPVEWANLPYGYPMDGAGLRVVNQRGEDCPELVPGEIWIGGAGVVGSGYRGDPERTAEKFLDLDDGRWYRTGDIGRYLPGGILDILGRRDHQVKIRGHRVELGEVESALVRQPGVDGALATLLGTGEPILGAAVAGRGLDPEALREGLAALLPAYMVPTIVLVTETMPTTRNGKRDRRAIEQALTDELAQRQTAPASPASDLEAALAFVMAAILERDEVGVTADFFELGGNSIHATLFVGRARSLLGVGDLAVADLFELRTPQRLAPRLLELGDAPTVERIATLLLDVAREGETSVPEPA
ncbi:MAG: amino acid adenylation domain-containing protein [Actinomycetota bacterium]